MPYLRKRATEIVALPSDPEYHVLWRTNVTYGEVKAIAKGLPKEDPNDPDSASARGAEIADRMLLLYIEDWNLDDEKGKKLPVTAASLNLVDSEDIGFLSKRLNTNADQKEEERKN
jgi:hypothetical protein